MPGSPPVPDRPALWAALSHIQIEEPGTGRRFEEVLAEENGWTLGFAERVADEYCRFLYLAATAGFEATPSKAVDQAWHLHLSWPHYRDILCREILGRSLHHRPGTGSPDDEARHRRQYRETFAMYERVFARAPPSDIWPRPVCEEELRRARMLRRGRLLSRGAAAGSLAGGLVAQAVGVPVVAVTLIGAAFLLFLLGLPFERAPRTRRRRGKGGSDCGGDWSLDGDASCGGGSCGGGCGGD